MADKLQRELSNRHIQLIAIGGAIGTGLFLGAGESIHLAGPSILLTYIIVGFVLFMFMRAMGEILLSNLGFKSFGDIAHHHIGPMAGFMVGWTYWLTWIISGMAEVTAVAKYVEFWYPAIPNWLTVAFTILVLVGMNLFSAKLFGELEFWLSLIKVITIIALIVVGIVMVIFAMKTDYGTASVANIWSHGGFFPNGISGFLMAFQMAIFSFIGIELIGITAGKLKIHIKRFLKQLTMYLPYINILHWFISCYYVSCTLESIRSCGKSICKTVWFSWYSIRSGNH